MPIGLIAQVGGSARTVPRRPAILSHSRKLQPWHGRVGQTQPGPEKQTRNRIPQSRSLHPEHPSTAPSCMTNVEVFLFTDRKSTRLSSSHLGISYAVFCLKKK